MTTIELEVEIPDLAEVEIETPDVEITPSGGATVLLVATPGPPGMQGPPGEGTPIVGEVLGGTIDGVNTVFTTIENYRPNTTAVCLNGLRETRNVTYTETTSTSITMDEPPLVGDILTIDYIVQ